MKFIIIENEPFQQLKALDRISYVSKRQQVTNDLYNDIEVKLGRKLRKAPKVQQVIRRILYLASDRGLSWPGRETLAKKLEVSTGTVDNAIRLLKDSGECDVFYRENPSSNSAKTCVFIFKRHDNYPAIKQILRKQYEEVWEEELRQKSTESKAEPLKKIATLLIQKKQDLKLNKRYHSISKMAEYVLIKLEEAQQNSPGSIAALSSYIDVTLDNELESARTYIQKKKETRLVGVPVYNWLEG